MTGLPEQLQSIASDSSVTDILVNNGTEVWFERCGELHRSSDLPRGVIDTHLERILSPLGRRLDRLSPMVDARLADGTRVCAVIPPIAVTGTCAAFRLFRQKTHSLDSFTDSPDALRELRCCDGNILVTGSTGSGKTSLVASLLARCPATERVVVIEDTHELPLRSGHAVRLEARPANAEGRGSVSLDDLLRTALRLRPDRIVVGEIRGPEALTFVHAMNTGHTGSMSTVHANSALDGLRRVELLVSQASPQWRTGDVRRAVASAVRNVVHLERHNDGRRIIDHIVRVDDDHVPRVVHRRAT